MDQITNNLIQANFILRYMRNEITAAEKQELESWLQLSEANRKLFEKIIDENHFKSELEVFESIEVNKGWEELVSKVNNSAKVMPIHKNNRSWLYAAAAAILLIGVFAIFKSGFKKPVLEEKMANKTIQLQDVAPGTNLATLTLADGSKIILDSSNNGNIASQGNTQIIKIDGKLAYDAEAAATEVLYNTISTPRGGQYQIELADGTKVWLNAASSLRFTTNFIGNKREVELIGEAYFEVAKNAAMPFVVKVAGKEEVEVLGTHFNINSYDDEPSLNTTLLEGKVKISSLHSKTASLILNPGEQALLQLVGKIQINKNADIDKVMAWKNNIFNFNNDNIETIMRQLSRWYDVDVKFTGAIPQVKFSGEIGRNLSLKQVLSILDETRIKYRLEGRTLLIGT